MNPAPAPSGSRSVTRTLGVQEAVEFWDRRHQSGGELRSGGDMSFDHATNEIFYALRLGRLIDIVGDDSSVTAPLRVLDAGCGKGYFARAMARFGHQVDGIDTSPHAVQMCRDERAGDDAYAVSALSAWSPPYMYDVVYSIDVLFHIMDDDQWLSSVCNLASLVRLGGRLVLVDHVTDADRVWGDYQKTRAVSRYRSLLTDAGFGDVTTVPYDFRDSLCGFHVCTRIR